MTTFEMVKQFEVIKANIRCAEMLIGKDQESAAWENSMWLHLRSAEDQIHDLKQSILSGVTL